MKLHSAFVLLVASAACSSAWAGGVTFYPATATTTTTGADSRTDTRGYVGLNWKLGGSVTPAVVLGLTNVRVNSNGDTSGLKLAFHLNLAGGVAPGMIKLSYLGGKEDFQGEIGAGYNFVRTAPFLGVGLNVPYVALGVDAYRGMEFEPFVTLNSQGKYDKPNKTTTTTYSCDPGDSLSGQTCTFVSGGT